MHFFFSFIVEMKNVMALKSICSTDNAWDMEWINLGSKAKSIEFRIQQHLIFKIYLCFHQLFLNSLLQLFHFASSTQCLNWRSFVSYPSDKFPMFWNIWNRIGKESNGSDSSTPDHLLVSHMQKVPAKGKLRAVWNLCKEPKHMRESNPKEVSNKSSVEKWECIHFIRNIYHWIALSPSPQCSWNHRNSWSLGAQVDSQAPLSSCESISLQ